MTDERVILATDFFLVQDSQGNVRRIYRTGCVRCGKATQPGREFCDGHSYMEGSRDGEVRHALNAKARPLPMEVRFWQWLVQRLRGER